MLVGYNRNRHPVHNVFESLIHWYGIYGYPVLFFGVLLENAGCPVPGESAVLVAGFLASPAGAARLRLGWIIAIAFLAAVLGDNAGYWLGRRFARTRILAGQRFVVLSPANLRRLESYFQRYGLWTVMGARFITGLRVICALAAGASAMPFGHFLLGNAVGALLWSTAMSLLGFFFGMSWEALHHWLGWGSWIVLGSLLLAVGIRRLLVYQRSRPR
jgi:membrane protein DedA with SNARE-associated domain